MLSFVLLPGFTASCSQGELGSDLVNDDVATASGSFTANGTGSAGSTGGGSGNNTSGTGGNSGTGGANLGTGGTVQQDCTDDPAPFDPMWPEANCDKWANEAAACGEDWFAEYCDASCGRCTTSSSGGSDGTGGNAGGNGSGSSSSTGGTTGEGNPWGPVSGNETGWASRYWDCCKQSCSWTGKGGNSPVLTCGGNGDNVVSSGDASACDNGSGTTCNSFAPWAYSSEVAFGFAATHAGSNVTCGTCYKLQFTGSSHNGGNDPGSQALNGKTMIVMAANIGGDVNAEGQLDLLIPGGGTGALYGCDETWDIDKGHPDLGAEYGGLRSGCGGDLQGVKSCVAQKCETLFKNRNLDDMYEGCMWYVNWFQAANNPNFKVEEISCPSELSDVAK